MKILKHGNPKLKERLYTCSYCGCIFVEREKRRGFDIEKGRLVYCRCNCPCCGCPCESDTIYTEEKDGDENG